MVYGRTMVLVWLLKMFTIYCVNVRSYYCTNTITIATANWWL